MKSTNLDLPFIIPTKLHSLHCHYIFC
uniref:Uncharacterized protein n=1 Tax=Rhizophora mucronata TaxID=61149 RepID=A0A2P2QP68_RHIMU